MAHRAAVSPALSRTVALVGHRGAGKTSLAELLLHAAGVVRQPGSVESGTALLDHDAEERRRRLSLQPGFAWLEWDGHRVQVVDLPGAEDPVHAWAPALGAVDGAVVVLSAAGGLEVGSENALEIVAARSLPTVVVINKLDRNPDVSGLLAELEARTGVRALPMQLPFFDDGGRFSGVVSLVQQRVLRYDDAGGGRYSKEPLPAKLEGPAAAAWDRMVEAVALTDDALLERYLEYLELPLGVVREQLAVAVRTRQLMPVVFTSATGGVGGAAVLDLLLWAMPSPLERPAVAHDADGAEVVLDEASPFVAQLITAEVDNDGVWRWVVRVRGGHVHRGPWIHQDTGEAGRPMKLYDIRGPRRSLARSVSVGQLVASYEALPGRPGDTLTDGAALKLERPEPAPPMMAYLLEPPPRLPRDAWRAALARVLATDSRLGLGVGGDGSGFLLTSSSQAALDRAVLLMRNRMGLRVAARLPPVPYRERVTGSVPQVQGIYRRTSAGLNEYGECWIELEPAGAEEIQFEDAQRSELLPARYLPPIEAGVREALQCGPKGFPVVAARVRCTGGEYDALDSTEEHFRLAGLRAGRVALDRAETELIEPWSTVELAVPAEGVGEVIADLSSRRGRVQSLEVDGPVAHIAAECPYRELRTWAPRLLSLTHGRGSFRWSWSGYTPVPKDLTRQILRELRADGAIG